LLQRKRALLKETARAVEQLLAPPASEGVVPSNRPPTRHVLEQQARRARRLARYEAVLALHPAGFTASQIARDFGIGRKTVGRYVRASGFPERARPRRRASILGPFEPYLRQRWAEGCHNALQLWRELRQEGFSGAAS